MDDPRVVEAGEIAYLFRMDPLVHLASDPTDRAIRWAAARSVVNALNRSRKGGG